MSAALVPDLLRELEARGAILSGHFRLSSGRHSNRFVQKFRILEDPHLVERVAQAPAGGAPPPAGRVRQALAGETRVFDPTLVVSAAVGGIVLGYETARQLGTF